MKMVFHRVFSEESREALETSLAAAAGPERKVQDETLVKIEIFVSRES
jgi:hypothetical protein